MATTKQKMLLIDLLSESVKLGISKNAIKSEFNDDKIAIDRLIFINDVKIKQLMINAYGSELNF